jgi:hypothetical protein
MFAAIEGVNAHYSWAFDWSLTINSWQQGTGIPVLHNEVLYYGSISESDLAQGIYRYNSNELFCNWIFCIEDFIAKFHKKRQPAEKNSYLIFAVLKPNLAQT